mmetsp:Transcript_406/g.760  ORF Transcript_406/g.760 Transcript_406/m.760 type:complete len:372 (-) Transcript_406:134-1249(-)
MVISSDRLGKAIESVRLWFEKGLIQDMWLRDHFSLEDGDKVCIDVRAYRDDEEVVEDRQTIMRKAVIEIGKHEDNDVVTGHPTTSRRHSLLLIDKNKGPLLIDLHSANGTYMDGAQIKGACPTSLSSGVSGVCFGASRKRYIFTIDLNADNRRKEQLYMKLSDPDVAKEDAAETTVFLGNLPYTCTEEDIINTFGSCGAIRQLTIPKDKTSGEGRGIAFITFETSSAMRQALTRDGDDVGGRAVKVKRSEAKGSSKPSEKPPSKGSKGSESGGGRSYYEGPKEETRHGGRPDRQERTRSISHSPDRRRQRRSRSGSRSRSSGRRHSRTRRNNRSRSRSGSVDEFGRRDKRSKPSRDRKRQRSRSSSSTYSR